MKENLLKFKMPKIFDELSKDKNNHLNVEELSFGSDKKAWWVCKLGHEYEMPVKNKVRYSCPYCSNQKLLKGYNDINTTHPELSKSLLNYEDGYKYSRNSSVKLKWKCSSCFSIVNVAPNGITTHVPCEYCKGKRVNHTNSLASLNPYLASEWHPTKNGDLTPNDVTYKANKKVWWLGKCGHEWITTVNSRSKSNTSCPYCAGQKALKGFNDMWTTNPELAKLLANPEDGYKYTRVSGKKVDWKCLDCGEILKNKIIANVSKKSI